MLLTIATRICDTDILVIELTGRITLGRESTHIEDTVVKAIAEGARKIVLDLSGVRYIDSSGLGIIALCFGKMSKAGGRFILTGATGVVLEVLQMTHLDSVIPFSRSVDEACAAMVPDAPATKETQETRP
jgi:anti-sigma B factor antagonist